MTTSEQRTKDHRLSVEALSALHACRLGDPYFRAKVGAQRAGRTRAIAALLRKGVIEVHPYVMGAYKLTEQGERIAEASPND